MKKRPETFLLPCFFFSLLKVHPSKFRLQPVAAQTVPAVASSQSGEPIVAVPASVRLAAKCLINTQHYANTHPDLAAAAA